MTPSTPRVVTLDENLDAVHDAGGKARGLSRWRRAGLPVPPGVVLPGNVHLEHLSRVGVEEPLRKLLASADRIEPDFLDHALRDLRTRLRSGSLPRRWSRALNDAVRHIGSPVLIARSSSISEDGTIGSAAGQFESVSRVSPEGIEAAVMQCWSSTLCPAPVRYFLDRGLDPVVGMGVLIQPFLPFEISGVLFTVDPMDPDAPHMRGEWVEGTAEELMNGKVDPATIRIPRGGSGAAGPAAKDPRFRRLGELALRLEAIAGRPMDIEFGFLGPRIWIVQGRPIARVPSRHHPSRLLADFNVQENLPDPVTPLGRSVFDEVFIRHMLGKRPPFWTLPFSRLKGDLWTFRGGRIYWNISGFARMVGPLRPLLGGSFTLLADPHQARGLNRALRGPWIPTDPLVPLANLLGRLLRDLISGPGRLWNYRDPAGILEEIGRDNEARLERFFRSAPPGSEVFFARVPAELIGVCWPLIDVMTTWAQPALLAMRLAAMQLRWIASVDPSVLLGVAGHETQTMRMNRRMIALGLSVGADPVARRVFEEGDIDGFFQLLDEPTEAGSLLKSFLEEFGHRARSELDLGRHRWVEAPGLLMSYIVNLFDAGDRRSPRPFQVPGVRPALAWIPFLDRWHRASMSFLLEVLRRGAPAREDPKHHTLRVFRRFREQILLGGRRLVREGRLENAQDVVWLRLSELEWTAGSGSSSLAVLVAARQQEWEEARQRPSRGLHWEPAPPSGWETEETGETGESEGPCWVGTPASAGRVRGRARLIRDPDRAARIEPGEILVAPVTDPSWTPLFLVAEGVVVETGGILSHAAVLARELDIPCVMGLVGALERIPDGALLEIDGRTGRVTLL